MALSQVLFDKTSAVNTPLSTGPLDPNALGGFESVSVQYFAIGVVGVTGLEFDSVDETGVVSILLLAISTAAFSVIIGAAGIGVNPQGMTGPFFGGPLPVKFQFGSGASGAASQIRIRVIGHRN